MKYYKQLNFLWTNNLLFFTNFVDTILPLPTK
jgi:hypothetical protein